MKNKKILLILLGLAILTIIIVDFITFNKKQISIEYPIYDNVEEAINKQNEKKEIELEIKDLKYAVPIFMYHWVVDDTAGYPYIENMVRPETLREQVEYIANNGYESVFTTELGNLAAYEKPVMLTFDDGFVSVYQNAFPILKEFNVKGTVFVISELVDTPGYCTKAQLKEMYESGLVDLQCHTATHPYLAQLTREQMHNEMQKCIDYLKSEFGITSTVMCYPYGSRNSITIEETQKLGFLYGLAMDGGIYYSGRDNDYEISRIYATRSMKLSEFVNYLSKSYVNVEI
ncbi:MAG: polysaccharide deacetylase family protein [Clostridia bacterium]|nr:polysaccharide deacetylase family protein [Clostridia bacterium]